ncbi:MAG TPA: ATP-binding protein [Candidatus Sulfotelmatobacter sp.]|nr:ATP-binding protein [Candidatus Sulfotelmatobacter sp.]
MISPEENDNVFQMSPTQAKILVCAFGALVALVDFSVPGDINIAIFYCLAIVLCVWTRSLVWIWGTTGLFIALTFAGFGFAPQPVEARGQWVHWANRAMTAGALTLVAVSIDLRTRAVERLARSIAERKRAEAALRDREGQLRLAQTAANIASWEWNPVDRGFNWSGESPGVFGIDPTEGLSFEKWLSRVDPNDVTMVKAAFEQCIDQRVLELEFRYHHPNQGLRWIYSKARVFSVGSGAPCIFGISQDITEQKQAEESLEHSHAALELLVEQRTSALQRLSSRLLRAQDEERRRIARELHDSIGQCLTALKINMDVLGCSGHGSRVDQVLAESSALLDQALTETRTISHLLHPPLLEECGFASAAGWYVDGFAKRSGIEVSLEIPRDLARLPDAVELGLFRVLQESLTNVHRHSASPSVDIRLNLDADEVILEVRDYGRGIPQELLRCFQEEGTGGGVGLTGMRERVSELGGRLTISAADPGIAVSVSMPASKCEDNPARSTRASYSARSVPVA